MSEDLLRATLRERADQTAYDPTPLGAIASTALSMRRRRRTSAVLMAAAAVVVITVPIAVVASRSDPDSAPVQPGPSEPVLTQDSTPPPPVENGKARPPQIAYAVDGEIIEPDGTRFTPRDQVGIAAFAPYQGGYLVAGDQAFEGSVNNLQYDAEERVLSRWVGGGFAVGPDGRTAWSSFSPPESGQSAPTLIHLDDASQEVEQIKPWVAGLLDDEVVFTGGGPTPQAWITDLVSEPRPVPGLRSASSAAGGLAAGQIDDYTAAVVDLETGEELWRESDSYAMELSPDGRYLHVVQGGLGRQDTIRDARTGDVITEIPGTGLSGLPGYRVTTWEDGTHLLGTLNGDIVRVDLEGNTSVAAALGRPDILDVGFAAQP